MPPVVAMADDGEVVLAPIEISSGRGGAVVQAPSVTESYSAEQIRHTINAATSAQTLKYLPSLQVRERYIGDRNGIVASRTAGTLSSAQTLLYADGILLSNLLGNSYAFPPRWGMVSPEEIEQVDVMYGPFSALYPGNSMGGVMNITTRMPEKFEAHANLQMFQQRFELYGTQQRNEGKHFSASIGNKVNDLSFWLGADHLDTYSQPMQFAVATASAAGSGVAVTGAYRDCSEKGQPRLVFGAYGMDHSVQDNAKLKLAYDITPDMKARYNLGIWQLDSETDAESYLQDAAGNPFYNGNVNIDGNTYNVRGLNPTAAQAVHLMQSLQLASHTNGTWDWHVGLSDYRYNKDISRVSTASNPDVSKMGTIQDMRGTGWTALDAGAIWRPGTHEVSFGYHVDHYALRSVTFNTTDWKSGSKLGRNSASQGDTLTQALYLQDAWRWNDQWKLTMGGRYEYWRAYDGQNAATLGGSLQSSEYADKSAQHFSPKLAISFEPEPAWGFTAAFGKAYRYPTVSELFQSITSGSNFVQANPDLQPERVLSGELTAERRFAKGFVRATLFHEHKQDALISQTVTAGASACGSATCSFIQNIDLVRTRGVELATQWQNVLVNGLDWGGSLTLTDAEILRNKANPETEGKHPARIPAVVAKAVATYHQNDALSYSLAMRYSGRQYAYLDNSDSNPDVYGGASHYFFIDARLAYQFADRWTATLGVDNLNNYKAYAYHPYPQRTAFLQVKFDY
ncbi:iron complex outermembrane recepter protein [Methylobacillus rhizosphaerae]|uniref:Iron complex outermembrane recepter protein n=1 Tax=Methylobacillus rhizosphaerae TaxID=551994 RepID=A0A239AAJ2_9PROT|nr:TonB-dependent receptor [Methylobacillus rhizosphaerae]SNR92351.1 iron complex outermembrane recepter protein [Methylobacillus rhizosphaerae]